MSRIRSVNIIVCAFSICVNSFKIIRKCTYISLSSLYKVLTSEIASTVLRVISSILWQESYSFQSSSAPSPSCTWLERSSVLNWCLCVGFSLSRWNLDSWYNYSFDLLFIRPGVSLILCPVVSLTFFFLVILCSLVMWICFFVCFCFCFRLQWFPLFCLISYFHRSCHFWAFFFFSWNTRE